MNIITAALDLLANISAIWRGVQTDKNTPEMKANKEAEIRSQDADRINTEIAAKNKGDPKAEEAIRRDLGEN